MIWTTVFEKVMKKVRLEKLRRAIRWLRRCARRINPQRVTLTALLTLLGTCLLSPVLGPLVTAIGLLVVVLLAVIAYVGSTRGRREYPQRSLAGGIGGIAGMLAIVLLLVFFVGHLEVGEIAFYKDKAVLVRRSGWVVGGNRPATFDVAEGLQVTLPVKVVDPQLIIESLSENDRRRLVDPVMVRRDTKTIITRALGRAIVDSARRQPLDQALRSHGLALSEAPSP